MGGENTSRHTTKRMRNLAAAAASVTNNTSNAATAMTPPPPPPATILRLPLGDINLLVLTDVHSWIGGHERHEPNISNADYGDVLSFYLRLKDIIRRNIEKNDDDGDDWSKQRDFFMVMNGDFMDGTGLSTVPPEHLTPLLSNMPFSIINVGNHELYHSETVEWISKEFIPHWRGHYLSSNTLLKATGESLGSRFAYLEGDHSTLLVFGFLYNFEGNCPTTIVERVQDVVTQEWFVSVLERQEAYDAILVMAHVGTYYADC
jgi:2',3'-cyclic-nucleotide 2'-phosphodiesterase (5'-nucleotidase family)